MIRALPLVALWSAVAHAGGPEALATIKLSLPERVSGQAALASQARARGDLEGAAAHTIEGCFAYLLLTFDPKGEPCVQAEQAAGALPSTMLLARLRGYQSNIVAWTLNWDAARALADDAERLARAGPGPETLAGETMRSVHLTRGGVELEAGRFAAVERELAALIRLSRLAGDRIGNVNGELFLCRFHVKTGELVLALEECNRGLAIARQLQDSLLLATLLWQRGTVESVRGDLATATATWEEGLTWAARAVAPYLVLTIRTELASALAELGRFDAATSHVDAIRDALAKGQAPPSFGFQMHWARGVIAAGRGDHRGAIESYRAAQASPIDSIATSSLVGEAEAHHGLGELAEAEVGYRAAIARVESARSGLAKLEQRAGIMQRQVRAYQELVAVLWDRHGAGAGERALAIAEAARARALLDALSGAGITPTVDRLLDAAGLQRLLPADTTLVMYVASARRLFGFAVTRDRVTMAVLGGAGTRLELGARVDHYARLLATTDDGSELAAPGAALYADLIAPLVGTSPTGTLVISADGPLHLLPFEALFVPGGGFLVEHVDVAMTFSGSLIAPKAAAPRSSLLAIAAPPTAPPFAPLLAGRAEADAITTSISDPSVVLVGVDATEARFRASEPAGFRVLHFATHAVIDDRVPLRSGLLMAPGGVDDGWLRADEIYRLHLGASLVVLSGCQTGTGEVSESEGPMSLARAFLYAGAHSVIATLWDVEDRHGPAMTRALYRELAAGQSIGGALGHAKRAMIRDGAPPRTWAPWIAIGAPAVRPTLTPVSSPDRASIIVVALVVLGGLALGLAVVLGLRRETRID